MAQGQDDNDDGWTVIGEYPGVSYTTDGNTGHQRLVTPHERPGDADDPYGGWRGTTPLVAEKLVLPDGTEPDPKKTAFLGADDDRVYRVRKKGAEVRVELAAEE